MDDPAGRSARCAGRPARPACRGARRPVALRRLAAAPAGTHRLGRLATPAPTPPPRPRGGSLTPPGARPHPPPPAAPAVLRAGDLTATHFGTGRLPRFAAAGFDGQLPVRVGNQHYSYTVRKHDTLWDIAG